MRHGVWCFLSTRLVFGAFLAPDSYACSRPMMGCLLVWLGSLGVETSTIVPIVIIFSSLISHA